MLATVILTSTTSAVEFHQLDTYVPGSIYNYKYIHYICMYVSSCNENLHLVTTLDYLTEPYDIKK